MRCIRRAGVALLMAALAASAGVAQEVDEPSTQAYLGAVAEFFELPRSEVSILAEWHLPLDEIPVVLFVARRVGISPEALVALRESGRGWGELTRRYRVDAAHFHVPLPASAEAGPLSAAYQQYRSLPTSRWGEISLGDGDIVGLVNLRLLAQTLNQPPERVLARADGGSWADLYARLISAFHTPRP